MNHPSPATTTDFEPARSVKPIHLTLAYYGAFIVQGLIIMALGATLKELAWRTGSQLNEISYSFMFRSMGFFLGSIFGGRIYDHVRSGNKILALGVGGMAFFSAFVPITPSIWLVIILFLAQGLAGSLINVGANTLLMWTHRARLGEMLNGLHFSWGLGAALSPLIVMGVEKVTGNIAWAYCALSFTAIPACWFLLRLPSPMRPQVASQEDTGQIKILLVVLVATFFFFYTGFEAAVTSWIHTYTIESGLGDKDAAYLLNSVFLWVFTFGRLLAIPIAARLRPRTILIANFLGCFSSTVAILHWSSSVKVLWIASCTLGFSMASMFPTMMAFAERRMHLSGKLTGYLFSMSSAGSMILPFVVGQCFVSFGPSILFYIILGSILIDLIVFATMMIRYPSHHPVHQK